MVSSTFPSFLLPSLQPSVSSPRSRLPPSIPQDFSEIPITWLPSNARFRRLNTQRQTQRKGDVVSLLVPLQS